MKSVTWVLRLLSIISFGYMCWLVYSQLAGRWNWSIPYVFMVTVFRLLSLVIFIVVTVIITSLLVLFLGEQIANGLFLGMYNTIILRMWYLHPYGVTSPLTNVNEALIHLAQQFQSVIGTLYEQLFTFLYFFCAAVGVALFLQSIIRMDSKFVVGAFISIQLILVIAAFPYNPNPVNIYNFETFPTDFLAFLFSDLQILVFVSFAYLEISYQMIYSHSVGKPVEERDDAVKKQLLALRAAVRRQSAIEAGGERMSTTAMSRRTGATAFSFVREALERKAMGTKEALERLDAISDVRRLQIFVDDLFSADPAAKDELTAKAAAPSRAYVITSTLVGSGGRFLLVIALSFILMNPSVFVTLFSLPPGIQYSVELLQPEILMLFLVPIVLMFPFVSMFISILSQREVEVKKESREALEKRRRELDERRREAARLRSIERMKYRKRRRETAEEEDEWDRALEEMFKK